jgi:hypothetical protein
MAFVSSYVKPPPETESIEESKVKTPRRPRETAYLVMAVTDATSLYVIHEPAAVYPSAPCSRRDGGGGSWSWTAHHAHHRLPWPRSVPKLHSHGPRRLDPALATPRHTPHLRREVRDVTLRSLVEVVLRRGRGLDLRVHVDAGEQAQAQQQQQQERGGRARRHTWVSGGKAHGLYARPTHPHWEQPFPGWPPLVLAKGPQQEPWTCEGFPNDCHALPAPRPGLYHTWPYIAMPTMIFEGGTPSACEWGGWHMRQGGVDGRTGQGRGGQGRHNNR